MSFVESVRAGDPAEAVARDRSPSLPERLLMGLLALIAAFLVWREFEPILLFRPVNGVVMGSGVEKTHYFLKRRTTHYAPQITYRYEVNGGRLLSWQYRRTDIAGSRSAASRQARRYAVGTRVPVWYNPLNPADSVLSREPDLLLFVILGILGFSVWRFSQASAARRNQGAPRPRI